MRWFRATRQATAAAEVAPPPAAFDLAWQLGGHIPPLAPDRLPVAVLLPGDQRAMRLGQGMDFEQLRPYQPGEPASRIDWRVSARGQLPMVRVLREPAQRQCHVVLDTGNSMFFGTRQQLKITQAMLAGAMLTAAALHQNLSVSLHTPGLLGQPCRHPSTHRAELLHRWQQLGEQLNAAPPTDQADWSGYRGRLYQQLPAGQLIVVLGDFLADRAADPSLMDWLPLATRHRLLLISLFDPAEAKLPDVGRVAFTGHGTIHRLNTHDPVVRAAVAHAFDARQAALDALAHTAHGIHLPLATTDSLKDLLTRLSEALAEAA